jgi:hypothetical protein
MLIINEIVTKNIFVADHAAKICEVSTFFYHLDTLAGCAIMQQ